MKREESAGADWPGARQLEVVEALEQFRVLGREREVGEIVQFVLDPAKKMLYVYGQPGSGKTHAVKELCGVLAAQQLEVYYSNLLIDPEFCPLGNARATTVLLVVDEFEGPKKDKQYLKQRDALEKHWRRQKRSCLPALKTIFISNAKCHEGVHFTPYGKDEIRSILEKTLKVKEKPMELLKRVHESTERADLRVGLNPSISIGPGAQNAEVFGQYHRFIKEKLVEGVSNTNVLYKAFIGEMKRRDIPVIPKELFVDILESYLDGV